MTKHLSADDIEALIAEIREAVKHIDKEHVVQALACAAVYEVADQKPCNHSSCFMHSIAIVHQVVDCQATLLACQRQMTANEEPAQAEPEQSSPPSWIKNIPITVN